MDKIKIRGKHTISASLEEGYKVSGCQDYCYLYHCIKTKCQVYKKNPWLKNISYFRK